MPGGNIRLVLPSLASKSDTSAAAQDKEQAFEKFLTDLYEGKPAIADDRQQFLKLLAKFEAFITTTKLLTAEDVVEDGGANHNRSFITYEMALGRFKTKINPHGFI